MSEVLKLEYDATTETLRVVVDAVRLADDGVTMVTVMGSPQPEMRQSLKDFGKRNPKAEAAFREVLKLLEPAARGHYETALSSPEAVRQLHLETMRAKEDLSAREAALAEREANVNATAKAMMATVPIVESPQPLPTSANDGTASVPDMGDEHKLPSGS